MYETNKAKIITKAQKKNFLRYNEYYGLQPTYDNLYKQSQKGSKFNKLFDLISNDNNILLAYRTIKRNKGSMTAGVNKRTILYWENKPVEYLLKYIKGRLQNYMPQSVRRVEIPKSNGKIRPLGIPCIEDRIVQQCIKQVLEPICEAKFHDHSYGFRPNRGTSYAISYVYRKINRDKTYFMVDIDIHGFFDNVHHGKLLKQIWSMGIQDRKVISIIGAMLKADIKGKGIPEKGVPQGGILSPLLSNIVLNELDWWVSNQWETFNTQHTFSQSSHRYKHQRRSNLKEMYLVRYADDFKVICKDITTARKAFIAVKSWLKERLSLDISEEKSQITDVRSTASEFLGFRIKARPKKNSMVVSSHICEKATTKIKELIKQQVKKVATHPTNVNIYVLNRLIAGVHNYYKFATNAARDFLKIHVDLYYFITKRTRQIRSRTGSKSNEYMLKYGHYGGKDLFIKEQVVYPILAITSKTPFGFNQSVCNYTEEGRKIIHTKLGSINNTILEYLSNHPKPYESVELSDNRISLYVAQKGLCAITKKPLSILDMVVHHITPTAQGGNDRYKNLTMICEDVHMLIHSTEELVIEKYKSILRLSGRALDRLNKFRIKVGNTVIE